MKNIKGLPILFFIVAIVSIAVVLTVSYYKSRIIDVYPVWTPLDAKSELIKEISLQYPQEVKDMNVSLPPPLFYYSDFSGFKGKKYVIYTTEGSGVQTIFAAMCFDVSDITKIKITGSYLQNPSDSYFLTDLIHLNPSNCSVK